MFDILILFKTCIQFRCWYECFNKLHLLGLVIIIVSNKIAFYVASIVLLIVDHPLASRRPFQTSYVSYGCSSYSYRKSNNPSYQRLLLSTLWALTFICLLHFPPPSFFIHIWHMHTYTHTHTHTHTHQIYTHTHALTKYNTHTHTHTPNIHKQTSNTHTHTHKYTHTPNTNTHTHTHTQTHIIFKSTKFFEHSSGPQV